MRGIMTEGTSGFLMWSTTSNVRRMVVPGMRRAGRGHFRPPAVPPRRPCAAPYSSASRPEYVEARIGRPESSHRHARDRRVRPSAAGTGYTA